MNKINASIVWGRILQAAVVSGLMVVAACAPVVKPAAPPTLTPNVIPTQWSSREAQLQSIEVKADPAQVSAVARGILTEACSKLGESQVQREGNTFRITVYVLSRTDIGCAQAETPFETTIPLDTAGLPAGTYTVMANGASAVFTLPVESAAPSPTAIVVPTASPAPTAAPTRAGCTDAAMFISDVTIPDNSIIAPNTAFTKTWRLKNTGSCTWDNSYLVSYISGTTMFHSPTYLILQPGQTVAPGQSVDVSVALTSPVDNGNYQSYWGLKKENGAFMPIQGGANGNSFYVKIRVIAGGTGSGNITGASIDIVLEQGSGAACTPESTYFVDARITADGPTTATYEINSTAGQIPAGYFQIVNDNGLYLEADGSVTFEQAGTKTINLRFVGPYPYPDDITVSLRVNGGPWQNTKLSCQ